MHDCPLQGDVIILEEAAYCDPGLVSEVYAKATPRPRRRCSRLTRRVLVCQRCAALVHAAVRPALYFNHSRLGQPCALPCSATTVPCVIVWRVRCPDYSKMMEMTDDYGNNIFETIKITLVCDDCLKTDHRARRSNPNPRILADTLPLALQPKNVDISWRPCRAGCPPRRSRL